MFFGKSHRNEARLHPAAQRKSATHLFVQNRSLSPTVCFGLNTFLYTNPFTNESVSLFTKLKMWGFKTVEIPVEALEHIDPAKVRGAAEKAGLAIGSICTWSPAKRCIH